MDNEIAYVGWLVEDEAEQIEPIGGQIGWTQADNIEDGTNWMCGKANKWWI
jgi:hypothetical protein